MHYSIKRIIIASFFMVIIITSFCTQSYAMDKWLFTVYGARLSANNLGETLTGKAHYEDSYLLSMSLARRIFSFREMVDIELAFYLPHAKQYAFVTRIHHRSGADGLFSGRLDASNAIGFWVKYTF